MQIANEIMRTNNFDLITRLNSSEVNEVVSILKNYQTSFNLEEDLSSKVLTFWIQKKQLFMMWLLKKSQHTSRISRSAIY